MYRKKYKDSPGDSTAVEESTYLETEQNNFQEYEEEERESISNEKDDFNNNLVTKDELSTARDYKKDFQNRHYVSSKNSSYFHISNQEIEKEKTLHSESLPNDFLASSDSYISGVLDEEKSFTRRDSLAYQTDLNKGSLSADERRLEYNRREAVTSSVSVDAVESNRERQSLRRSSSLSTIPSYFYPDPYSIVVARYLEDLGSLSSYSSASGSEATEYLQLSQAATPEVPFDSARSPGKTRVVESALLSGEGESESSVQALIDKMNFDSALSTSDEYQSFRSSVPLRKICVEADGSKEWKVYDAGPKSIRTPLLCLGPASATADVFYKQILNLTARGLRVISVEGPVYWTVEDWCKGLKKLLDCLNLDKVHIFGASLGGFLAQKFAEYTYHYSRVASLILCNTFLDTSIFDYHDSAMIFWMLPSVILKKLIIENITAARIMDLEIAHAIEFMIERLNNLTQQELASRMTLNCVNSHVDTFKLKPIKMTIMDVFDESALSNQAREDLARNYTDAKLAHLKSGGNFPYLSRSDDVSMHIMVHLRAFNGTKHSAQLEETPEGIGSSNAISVNSTAQKSGSNNFNTTNAEDVLGLTGPQSLPTGSLEDKNQAFKEKAASVLGLPVK